MRQTILILSCALFSVAGCGDDTTTRPTRRGHERRRRRRHGDRPRHGPRVPNGVACGSATCPVGQDCCRHDRQQRRHRRDCACASAASCTAGSVLACDGPEDCAAPPRSAAPRSAFRPRPRRRHADANGGNASARGTCDFIGRVRFVHDHDAPVPRRTPTAPASRSWARLQTSCCSSDDGAGPALLRRRRDPGRHHLPVIPRRRLGQSVAPASASYRNNLI